MVAHKKASTGIVRIRLRLPVGGYISSVGPRAGARSILEPDEDPSVIDWVVPKGKETKTRDIALGEEPILEELLNMDVTPEGVARFASRWGLFSFPDSSLLVFSDGSLVAKLSGTRPAPSSMIVEDFYKLKHQIRDAWKAVGKRRDGLRELDQRRGNFSEAAIGEATIVRRTPETKKQGAPQFLWYVKDLHAFIWLELQLALRGGIAAELLECAYCGTFFSRSAKGPASETCSPAHKKALERARKAGEIPKRRVKRPLASTDPALP